MQLELIGCTGAGKSTLAANIVGVARAKGVELVLGDDVVTRRLRLGNLSFPAVRTTVIHTGTLSACLTHGRQYRDFLATSYRSLQTMSIPQRQRWNQFRKLLKQLGRYDVIRRTCHNEALVLVDEGTVHSAHNLFVHLEHRVDEFQLQRFAESVPLPDVVVYVRVGEEQLIERTLRRGHRRIVRPTRRSVTWFVRQALSAFDQITQHERIAQRTLVIQDGVIIQRPCERASLRINDVVDLISLAVQEQATVEGDSPLSPPRTRPVGTH